MDATPKRKLVVEVISTPRDRLASAASVLTSATKATANEYDRRIADAKDALAPVVAEAAATLAAVERLWAERGESLQRLSYIDWNALRLRGVSPDLLNRVSKLLNDVLATFSGARSELQSISGRIASLGRHQGLGGAVVDDLEMRNFGPVDWEPGAMHQREPTLIRADVARHTKVADAIREQLATLEYVVGQVEEKLKAAKASGVADGVAVSIERPDEFRPHPKQTRADSEFDPLSYGRS